MKKKLVELHSKLNKILNNVMSSLDVFFPLHINKKCNRNSVHIFDGFVALACPSREKREFSNGDESILKSTEFLKLETV